MFLSFMAGEVLGAESFALRKKVERPTLVDKVV